MNLSRRERGVAFTAALGALFLVGAVAALAWPDADETYLPGQPVEGLSAELERSVPEDHPQVTFVDATRAAGIDFRHFAGRRSSRLPEDMGSGAAWVDYDRDGWLDLFVVNESGPLTWTPEQIADSPAHAALYHNDGDGTFTEVSAEAGVDLRGWGMGTAWGDANNDGWPDLFVSAYGTNRFYLNNGDGTFREATDTAGLGDRRGFWTGATWGDYDRDGDLDLYVTGYVQYTEEAGAQVSSQYDVETPASINPSSFEPERNLLYRNDGDATFTEVAEQAGVDDPEGRGLMATWADLTGDGWPDLYVANDVSDNRLYRNRGDGAFEDISHEARVADYRGAMGLAVGDWDEDEDLDLFISHWIAQENALYTNLGRPAASQDEGPRAVQFMDQADRYGLGQIALDYVGWGASFFDYDNNGRLDLFVANGSTLQQADRPERLAPMPDLLFWNRGPEAGFYDASAVSGTSVFRNAGGAPLAEEFVGRGTAFGDYDNDGDVDIFVVNHDGPGQLLRNESDQRHHWLKVRLEGSDSNRSAIGARLRVVTGSRVRVREVGAQGPYLSQNSRVQHFGLGEHATIDKLKVVWPSGHRQVEVDIPADQTIDLREEPLRR